MFSFPVTVPVSTPTGLICLDVHVAIDEIAVVVNLLDKSSDFGVESFSLYQIIPKSEIIFNDGRKLPVINKHSDILQYLDAYRALEGFYTKPVDPEPADGVVVQLFRKPPCVTTEESTPV